MNTIKAGNGMTVKRIDLNTSILANNETWADKNARLFKQNRVYAVNIMSSPGSGKTTILQQSFQYLLPALNLGVIVGDIATTEDAERMQGKGVPVVQINTHGACHLDARMISGVLDAFDLEKLDLIIIENIGNLVCPADFSFGEHLKVAVLSTTEGNDKVRKYPDMFRKADAVLVNKIDLLPYVDFDMDVLRRDIKAVGSHADIFEMAARNGEGVEAWCRWLIEKAKE